MLMLCRVAPQKVFCKAAAQLTVCLDLLYYSAAIYQPFHFISFATKNSSSLSNQGEPVQNCVAAVAEKVSHYSFFIFTQLVVHLNEVWTLIVAMCHSLSNS